MKQKDDNKIQYAEDDHESISLLLKLRIPSLLVGLGMGILLSFTTSRFEGVLRENIALAYFIPFIVYISSAVGTQTQSIYIRDLKTGRADFRKYLFKETVAGLILGVMFAIIVAPIILYWFQSGQMATAISLATLVAIASAPLVALIVTEILQIEHTDPAVGAGPIATVIQDIITVVIYGLIASAIILG